MQKTMLNESKIEYISEDKKNHRLGKAYWASIAVREFPCRRLNVRYITPRGYQQ